MRTLGNVLLIAAFVAFAIFPIAYQVKTRGGWRTHPMGRHLMGFMLAFAVILTFAVANLAWAPLPDWVRPLSFAIAAYVGFWRDYLLIFRDDELAREYRARIGEPDLDLD